jgi:hypothetical protein
MNLIPWWWKLIGAGAIVLAAVLAKQAYDARLVKQGDGIGYARAKGEWAEAERRIKDDAEHEAAIETGKARQETVALQKKFDQLADSQQNDRIDHENEKRIAVAAALAGTERLSFPARSESCAGGAVPQAGAAEDSGTGAGAGAEARTFLLPGTAAAIFRIAADDAQLVRDYNSLVDRYAAARAICNAD